MNKEPWFSVRCIFEHHNINTQQGATTYEERIIVLRAENLDDAIIRGEEEAQEYVACLKNVSYTGFVNAYHLFAGRITDKTEVFSLMRDSSLAKEAYLDHFFDSGSERETEVEE